MGTLQKMRSFPENTNRYRYFDLLKGILIFLVVFGHCIQYGSGTVFYTEERYFGNIVFKGIYAFHMPLFAVVSGYLFYFSTQKRSENNCFRKQLTGLCVPIFAWQMSLTFAKRVMQIIFLGECPEFSWVIDAVWNCLNSLWFLQAIFLCSAIVLLNRKFFGDSVAFYLFVWAILLFVPDVLNSDKCCYLYPYYIGAYLFNRYSHKQYNTTKIQIIGFSATVIFLIMLFFYEEKHFIYTTGTSIFNKQFVEQMMINMYRWGIGLVGSIMMLWLVHFVDSCENKLLNCFTVLGRNTLGIYIISNYANTYVLKKVSGSFSLNYGIILCETIIMLAFTMGSIWLLQRNKIIKKIYLGGR